MALNVALSPVETPFEGGHTGVQYMDYWSDLGCFFHKFLSLKWTKHFDYFFKFKNIVHKEEHWRCFWHFSLRQSKHRHIVDEKRSWTYTRLAHRLVCTPPHRLQKSEMIRRETKEWIISSDISCDTCIALWFIFDYWNSFRKLSIYSLALESHKINLNTIMKHKVQKSQKS